MNLLWRTANRRRVVCESVPLVTAGVGALGLLLLLPVQLFGEPKARAVGWIFVFAFALLLLTRRRFEFDRASRLLRMRWVLSLGPRLPALPVRAIAEGPLADFEQVAVLHAEVAVRRDPPFTGLRRIHLFTVAVSRRAAERLSGFFPTPPIELVIRHDRASARRDAERLAADLELPFVDRS